MKSASSPIRSRMRLVSSCYKLTVPLNDAGKSRLSSVSFRDLVARSIGEDLLAVESQIGDARESRGEQKACVGLLCCPCSILSFRVSGGAQAWPGEIEGPEAIVGRSGAAEDSDISKLRSSKCAELRLLRSGQKSERALLIREPASFRRTDERVPERYSEGRQLQKPRTD